MNIADKIEKLIAYNSEGSYSSNFDKEYQNIFADEGERKTQYIISDLLRQSKNKNLALNNFVYLCIGGADGSESESILKNTEICHSILIEFSDSAADNAKKRAHQLQKSGKYLYVLTGDANQKLDLAINKLEQLKDDKDIHGLVLSAQAVLHELPTRSPGYQLHIFLGRCFRLFNNNAFYAREPISPEDWPDLVELSIPGITGKRLEVFSCLVNEKLKITDNKPVAVGSNYVNLNNKLALEVLHKLLRSRNVQAFKHELQEQLTCIDPYRIKKIIEKDLGLGSTRVEPFVTEGFSDAWNRHNVKLRTVDGDTLSIPNTHARILAFSSKQVSDVPQNGIFFAKNRKTNNETNNYQKISIIKPKKISRSRLPVTHSKIFGREKELGLMDQYWYDNDTNMLSIIAWGGVGKTALLNSWLNKFAERNYDGAEVLYSWSFYNQGTTDRVVSSDLFIESALKYFGDTNPSKGTAWEKGERLANLIRKQCTLLILDGIEPLQYPPGTKEGKLKNSSMKALLKELATQNNGLCLLTSRLQLSDLNNFKDFTFKYINLVDLHPKSGARLLKAQGVKGSALELERTSEQFRGHCLTLTLLGSYIADAYFGDIKLLNTNKYLKANIKPGNPAYNVINAYEDWFGECAEISLLRVLGLFDRSANIDAINALKNPPIEGLTDNLHNQSEEEWRQTLTTLRRIGLLNSYDSTNPDTLDLHLLVRQYFGDQLKNNYYDAWIKANIRLYEYNKEMTKEFPDTIEEMEPLFLAVIFACKAKKFKNALHEIYLPRIMRFEKFYASTKLEALGTLLYILSHFFKNGNWAIPYDEIEDHDKYLIYRDVGQYLASTRGYADPDVGKCYSSNRILCDRLNKDEYVFEVLLGQIRYYRMRCQLDTSGKLAQEVLDLCHGKNEKYSTFAHRAVATNYYYTGDFTKSLEHAKLGIIKHKSKDEAIRNAQFDVNEPAISCMGYVALCFWFLGEPSKAKEISIQTVDRAIDLNHKHTYIVALYIETLINQYLRYRIGTKKLAKKLIDQSSEYGFPLWRIAGEMLYGWSIDEEDGIGQIEYGVRSWEATGARLFSSYWRALLAERYLHFGYYNECLKQVKKALEMVNKFVDRHWEAELYRIKFETLAAQNKYDDVEQMISKALEVSRKQRAISLELRSATSAFHIVRKPEQKLYFKELIKELIKEIYYKFNEDLDIYDLVKAKQIIE